MIEPEDIEELVVSTLPQTALFSSRFRECAGRALLLPRRRPDQRTPLWQQRQRAADLLAVAAKYPTFPILLEASRECLQDVFDVPALREVLGQLRSRSVRVVTVDTTKPSPMAQSLLFNWIAAYMYEGDAPLAERRAAALALDRDLLRDLLGAEELRELLDPGVLADVELDLQRLSDGRRARSADELHDVLRRVGDLTAAELDLRSERRRAHGWLAELLAEKRAIEVVVAGEARYVAADDAARYRDALGCALPLGLPAAFTDPVPRPLEDLVARYARTHGPFTEREVGRPARHPRVARARRARRAGGRRSRRARRVPPRGRAPGVVRQRGAAPAAPALAGHAAPRGRAGRAGGAGPLPAGVARRSQPQRRGVDAVVEALGLLAGAPIVASTLESDVLSARVDDYRAGAARRAVHVGRRGVGRRRRDRLERRSGPAVLRRPARRCWRRAGRCRSARTASCTTPSALALAERGASFWNQLQAAGAGHADDELLAALWDLVWAGEVTNDSLAPLRAVTVLAAGARPRAGQPVAGRRPGRLTRIGPPAGAGRWSLVAPLLEPAPAPTEAAHAMALQLVERHGVVTREAVLAEGVVGGYASVYGVLKVLEERGQVRRGYFVSGLGAAQFALPGRGRPAAPGPRARRRWHRRRRGDRRAGRARRHRSGPAVRRHAGVAGVAGRPARTAAALVVLRDGVPIAWYDRRSHHLVTFPHTHDDRSWAEALADQVRAGRLRRVEVRKVDGEPLATSPVRAEVTAAATAAGFTDGYRGLDVQRAVAAELRACTSCRRRRCGGPARRRRPS